ncbi:MAG: hypothetical protein FWG19_02400 [Methanomassiliicoccaceae archaeon]|nr:hypothetical protein [Methanomassiliicoccaceae archaeon]
MNRKIYLTLGMFCFIALVTAFAVFVSLMITMEDPFEENIIFYIFGWLGISGVLMVMMAVFFVKYFRFRTVPYQTQMTKRCVSCGEIISVTDHSCPRCYTIQPADGKGQYGR